MTLEEKINLDPEITRLNNELKETMSFLAFGLSSILMLTFIAYYIEINTKRYEKNQGYLIYKVEAIKQRDTQIKIYNKNKYIKSCTIPRSKTQFVPLVKGGYNRVLERRTEEYIMPTEKELNDCYNIN